MTQTFQQWFHQVNRFVDAEVGLSVHDLEDCCFADWFEDGVRAGTAAKRALRQSGFGAAA